MSLQIPQQQFNSLSSKALNSISNNNDNLSSTERLNTSSNQNQQKQQALLFTPNSQNTQKSMTPQPHLQQQFQQVGLVSPNIYTNSSSLQNNNANINTSNMRFQKNLNSLAFNNHNDIKNQQTQLIVHHQNNSSNNSESLCSDLRSFFQDNISGINSQFTGTLSVNKNNNNNYSSIIQGSKNGSMNSNQHRIQVMTPSTNDDKSILSQNNHFISTNPKQVDLSSSSQSHHNQHLLHSQVHSKNVSQTTQMSVFNNSGEISQFNYSSLGNNQNFQSQNQMSNISSVINNINFENDTLSSSQQQNTSISNISNTLQEAKCRFHPYKKVKYQMSQNENEKFCTACALEYAKQGLDVEPIIKTQQKEINLYMNEMLNVKNINDMLMNSLDSKQEFIKEHSRKQSQIVQDLFLQIEKLIYEQKTQLLSQINNKMWEQINLIELKKNDSRLFEQKLLLKQQDIEKNYQQITTAMGVSEVREILFFYNSELDQIKTSISDMFKNTSFDLINLNQNQIAQQIQILQKFLQEEVFKPTITQSTLQESINLLSNKSNSPSKNDKNQLSRFMSNQDKKGSGKKQQYQQQQIQNKTLAQQLQNYHIEQSQLQPNVQKVIELNCAMNKQNTQSQNLQKQNYQQNEQMNFNQQKEQQQMFATQLQQKQLQQQQQQQQQYNEIVDTSISEKQHTQESDDLSSAQGIYLNIQNQSKISNKSNISSHKIINYSDIHDEQNLNILKDSSSPSTSAKQIVRDSKATPVTQEKKPFFPFQCLSPQQTSKGEGTLRQQYSISKDNQLNQRQKQFIQTEPTHLPSNKTKQGISKPGNYQRNLLMNDEIATSNNRFKFNQNPTNNFSLLTHFNKQTNSNIQNLVAVPQINNKQQEQAQNFTNQSKLNAINNIRQLQINLVDQDSNQKSLTSRPIIMNQINNNQQFANSQNQQPNFVAQLIQQKQQQNTLKNTPNYQQLQNNDYNSMSSLKN
ncbi:hypothetical protein TTHERM_00945250 (macronuclear) [Tetrahymena thermophila SB210]|uniref:Uncharacterized protein n=1 Tax=Tetrahymena thermophila (strain SB210) TaxID=312017 RepID=Q24F20_TETTS|nr:hypothetical protein TTHERM_00945250 [Tetrahymena thermophila SB210]EAS06387.2 hypothetical protein TTHERM_00945250 [Tetrahymena thermophila SB210]|eukprot:XP_001026632.2 hypothetical protein TTHERM_00945250 [Tetrahymena thermophila SB210]